MKKLILLCTVFAGVIANAYINEDNEYAPNPTAKEIVIYDSGDAPKQEIASKDFTNLKLLKSRSKTDLKITSDLQTKTYSYLKFNVLNDQQMGGKAVSLFDTKKKVMLNLMIVENPTETLESMSVMEGNKFYNEQTNEIIKVINKNGKIFYAVYKLSDSTDTAYTDELYSLYEEIISNIY